MSTAMRTDAVQDARSVAAAASAVLRTIRNGEEGLDVALDRLEVQAVRVVGEPVRGFDAVGGAQLDDEDLLAAAMTQLGIGDTLLSAEAAVESAPQTDR